MREEHAMALLSVRGDVSKSQAKEVIYFDVADVFKYVLFLAVVYVFDRLLPKQSWRMLTLIERKANIGMFNEVTLVKFILLQVVFSTRQCIIAKYYC